MPPQREKAAHVGPTTGDLDRPTGSAREGQLTAAQADLVKALEAIDDADLGVFDEPGFQFLADR